MLVPIQISINMARADPGFWNGGWIFVIMSEKSKYYFNTWGIRKKKKEGGSEKGGWKFTRLLTGKRLKDRLTPGPGCSQPLKLTQYRRGFWINFCSFLIRFSAYIICPSVVSLCDVKLHKTKAVENIFIEGKLVPRLTFNAGLELTTFWTNLPWRSRTELSHIKRSFSWAEKSSKSLRIRVRQ